MSERLRQIEADIQKLEEEKRTLLDVANTASCDRLDRDSDGGKNANLLSPDAKIKLFRSRFTGRSEFHAKRWEGRDGKNGYAPACANEWQRGICGKPIVHCNECKNQSFLPVTDETIREHLLGGQVVGLYILNQQSCCHFLAADFDHKSWREDAQAFVRCCRKMDIPVLPEISRSGDGAHIWFFFDSPVPAKDARRLGTALIERTCRDERLISLSSHDRLLPSQDFLTGASFGSLVALPLQKAARAKGASVFTDDNMVPVADQWQALHDSGMVQAGALAALIERVEDGHGGFDTHPAAETKAPWRRSKPAAGPIAFPPGALPDQLAITLAGGLYIERTGLPQELIYAIARLAAFANPHWYELERTHRSTHDTARYVDKSQLFAEHIKIPRGCYTKLVELLGQYPIELTFQDERIQGTPLDASFVKQLRPDQDVALRALSPHSTGVLQAHTAFGKTVLAIALIAKRGCSALIIVNTDALLRQWCKRLGEFLSVEPGEIGTLGGRRKRSLTGRLDVASVRSLAKMDAHELGGVLDHYGQIVVDECHHTAAHTYVRVLADSRSKYVLGLTATPRRRDGLEPLVFMLCGPIRHIVPEPENSTVDRVLEVLEWPIVHDTLPEVEIQTVLGAVATDQARTRMIAEAALEQWRQGRKVLLLTERRAHINALVDEINGNGQDPLPELLILHGKLTSRVRRKTEERIDSLTDTKPRLIIATGSLLGEGFDHPPLDTVLFGMPFAWDGKLQQYLGRLGRPLPGKHDVRVIDVNDTGHPMLESMWRKRKRGYRKLRWREIKTPQLF